MHACPTTAHQQEITATRATICVEQPLRRRYSTRVQVMNTCKLIYFSACKENINTETRRQCCSKRFLFSNPHHTNLYRTSVRLLKQHSLFVSPARFAELGVLNPETAEYVSYGVYLLTQHPFDALHQRLPGDSQVRAVAELDGFGIQENKTSTHTVRLPAPVLFESMVYS